jgi:pilus assembly protein FimV
MPATRPDREAVPRWSLGAIATLGVLVIVFGYLQTQQTVTVSTVASNAAGTANSLAAQLANACSTGTIPLAYAGACGSARQIVTTPVPGPPGSEGASGTPGAAGAAGVPGTAGQQGAVGASGLTPACYYLPTACAGQSGAQGSPGVNGVNGASGTDGVPGPAGPAGPPGAAGADGKDGSNGRDGRDGLDGCDAGQHHDASGACVADDPPVVIGG